MARLGSIALRPLLLEASARASVYGPPCSAQLARQSFASTSRLASTAVGSSSSSSKEADHREAVASTSNASPLPEVSQPKRRGRPPKVKSASEDAAAKVPKRRGRKKATPDASSEETGRLAAEVSTETPAKPKRGRKPKEENVAANAVKRTAPNPTGTRRSSRITAINPDPTTPFAHLPAPDDWRKVFNIERGFLKDHRYFVANEDTTKKIADRFDLAKWRQEAGGRKLTIIECYAGPGSITRSLIQSEHVDRIIALEENEGYMRFLKQLPLDPTLERVAHLEAINKSPYRWKTYTELIDEGFLDHIEGVKENRLMPQTGTLMERKSSDIHQKEDWQQASPIVVLFTLPNAVHGEQLFSQLVHAIAARLWLFRYGRVRLAFVCSEHLASRSLAEPGDKLRTRLSSFCDALTDREMLLDSSHFTPIPSHIWPTTSTVGAQLPHPGGGSGAGQNAPSGKSKENLCLFTLIPKVKPLLVDEDMEPFEFITRNLFVLRSTPIGEALKHVAPGAQNVLNMITAGHPALTSLIDFVNADRPEREQVPPEDFHINHSTRVSDLTIYQWVALAKMFDRWPFRPENLLEEQMPARVRRAA